MAGVVLWMPAHGRPSTANSDLGLALFSGGLALAAGAVVSYVIFVAEHRFETEMRAREERAQLQRGLAASTDLRGIDLRRRDLSGIVLTGADLSGANLAGANLTNAVLHAADLSNANFSGASLMGANLRGARLSGADLRDAVVDQTTVWPDAFDASSAHLRDAVFDRTTASAGAAGGALRRRERTRRERAQRPLTPEGGRRRWREIFELVVVWGLVVLLLGFLLLGAVLAMVALSDPFDVAWYVDLIVLFAVPTTAFVGWKWMRWREAGGGAAGGSAESRGIPRTANELGEAVALWAFTALLFWDFVFVLAGVLLSIGLTDAQSILAAILALALTWASWETRRARISGRRRRST